MKEQSWGVGTRNGDSHAEQHVTDKGLDDDDDDDDDDHYRGPQLEQVTAMQPEIEKAHRLVDCEEGTGEHGYLLGW